jgi:hypothetical protein
MWIGLQEVQENYANHYRNDADDTLEQFKGKDCERLDAARLPSLAAEPALYTKR